MTQARKERFYPGKILVPVDFSVHSEAALAAATELARLFGAELSLLHVVPLLPDATGISFFREEELLEQMREEAECKLQAKVEELEAAGHRASYRVEMGNDVVGNILVLLEREQADLVVLSTHGVTGWRPMVFGSVAEKVLKMAQCPVLLFPAPRDESSEPEKVAERGIGTARAERRESVVAGVSV
jgi:nucleotide-binding universal stress UspA family protein